MVDRVRGGAEFILGASEKLEVVDRFCYLGDMLGKGGGAEESSRVRVKCAWGKFNELAPILTMRGASLRLEGKSTRHACRGCWFMVARRGL